MTGSRSLVQPRKSKAALSICDVGVVLLIFTGCGLPHESAPRSVREAARQGVLEAGAALGCSVDTGWADNLEIVTPGTQDGACDACGRPDGCNLGGCLTPTGSFWDTMLGRDELVVVVAPGQSRERIARHESGHYAHGVCRGTLDHRHRAPELCVIDWHWCD